MADLDLRGARDLSGKLHLVANLPSGKSISYCYIRKNACSTLRSFFISMSPSGRKPQNPSLNFWQEHTERRSKMWPRLITGFASCGIRSSAAFRCSKISLSNKMDISISSKATKRSPVIQRRLQALKTSFFRICRTRFPTLIRMSGPNDHICCLYIITVQS